MRSQSAALLRATAALLAAVVAEEEEGRPAADPAPAAACPAPATPGGWRMFSDEEQAIVDALRGKGAMTSEELAGLLKRDAGTAFRCTLRGLKKRGVIEMSATHGVRLLE